MNFSADLLAVEAAMSSGDRERFLATWVRINPQQQGVRVADVLDILESTDALLEVTEPMWDEHGDEAKALGIAALVPLATYALFYSTDETELEQCLWCGGTKRTPHSALFPARECTRCDEFGRCSRPKAPSWEQVKALAQRAASIKADQ